MFLNGLETITKDCVLSFMLHIGPYTHAHTHTRTHTHCAEITVDAVISSWPIYQTEYSPLALVNMKEQSCSSQAPQGLPLRLFSSWLVSWLQHPPVAPLVWRPTGLAGSCFVPSPLVPVGILTALDEKLLTLVQVPPHPLSSQDLSISMSGCGWG